MTFAKKRRLLREHRAQMRVMEEYRVGLPVEFDFVPLFEFTEDGIPDAERHRENDDLRREATDQQAFISAVQDLRAYGRVRLSLERARMQLEDRR